MQIPSFSDTLSKRICMEINTRIKELHDAVTAVRPENRSHSEHHESADRQYSNVPDTPENRHRIDRAIRALDIFNPNHPNTRFRYSVHSDTGSIQVELYNYLTGEVMQKIPSNKLLDYAARIQELSGLLLEEHA
ncbi:MAG: flagellar protein FlaG [Leptonema illini]|nr:MAG: flagellar protein FlaG [Leptonema illini]PKL33217.1 MAG: hypothetical protein CVV45_08775 [Spirochaetae bacterium HGW-Spirochaetae-10]